MRASSIHLPQNKLNIIKAFTEGSHVWGRVWAFGHEVGAEFVEISFLSVFACLSSNLKPLLKNIEFVFTETFSGLGVLMCGLESSESHGELVIGPVWYL